MQAHAKASKYAGKGNGRAGMRMRNETYETTAFARNDVRDNLPVRVGVPADLNKGLDQVLYNANRMSTTLYH